MHSRFLFEPQHYPGSTFTHIFDAHFGAAERSSVCSIEFEPNPDLSARHHELQQAYAAQGWRVIYAPYAVGAARAQLTFYRNDDLSRVPKHTGISFGMVDRSHATTTGATVNVTTIDFPRLVRLLEARRRRSPLSAAPSGRVVVKMDIEGAEYAVIDSMISQVRQASTRAFPAVPPTDPCIVCIFI